MNNFPEKIQNSENVHFNPIDSITSANFTTDSVISNSENSLQKIALLSNELPQNTSLTSKNIDKSSINTKNIQKIISSPPSMQLSSTNSNPNFKIIVEKMKSKEGNSPPEIATKTNNLSPVLNTGLGKNFTTNSVNSISPKSTNNNPPTTIPITLVKNGNNQKNVLTKSPNPNAKTTTTTIVTTKNLPLNNSIGESLKIKLSNKIIMNDIHHHNHNNFQSLVVNNSVSNSLNVNQSNDLNLNTSYSTVAVHHNHKIENENITISKLSDSLITNSTSNTQSRRRNIFNLFFFISTFFLNSNNIFF
jgi:hypothetical protein